MIDPDKKYRTRRGDEVEIVSTRGREPHPVIGYGGAGSNPAWWTSGGKSPMGTRYDLIEARTAEEVVDGVLLVKNKPLCKKICQALREAGKLREGE